MSTGTSASLCCSLFVSVFMFVSADQKIITAESGQDTTLPCEAPSNNIRVIEWRRPDLKPELVLVYRDGKFVSNDQHPSFKNRVDLQDKQMKDGDVSLILKNVTAADNGTYKCRVFMEETHSWKLLSNITLTVSPPGQPGGQTEDEEEEDGSVGLIVGLSVAAVLLVAAVVGFLIFRKHKPQILDSSQPPVDV